MNTELNNLYNEHAFNYDSVGGDDAGITRINIANNTSSVLDENEEIYIEGAKQGHIVVIDLKQSVAPKDILIMPIHFIKYYAIVATIDDRERTFFIDKNSDFIQQAKSHKGKDYMHIIQDDQRFHCRESIAMTCAVFSKETNDFLFGGVYVAKNKPDLNNLKSVLNFCRLVKSEEGAPLPPFASYFEAETQRNTLPNKEFSFYNLKMLKHQRVTDNQVISAQVPELIERLLPYTKFYEERLISGDPVKVIENQTNEISPF